MWWIFDINCLLSIFYSTVTVLSDLASTGTVLYWWLLLHLAIVALESAVFLG